MLEPVSATRPGADPSGKGDRWAESCWDAAQRPASPQGVAGARCAKDSGDAWNASRQAEEQKE